MTPRSPLLDIIKSHHLFWMVCAGLFVVNLLFYLFFVTTESGKAAQLQTRFQAERKTVSELRKRQAAIEHFTALKASWNAFEETLPAKIQSPERIDQLKQILNRHRLTAEDLSFRSEPVSGAPLVRFSTTFETSGRYEAFKRFIGDLQTMPGLFCIHQLEIGQAGNGGSLEMTMALSAYFSSGKTGGKP